MQDELNRIRGVVVGKDKNCGLTVTAYPNRGLIELDSERRWASYDELRQLSRDFAAAARDAARLGSDSEAE